MNNHALHNTADMKLIISELTKYSQANFNKDVHIIHHHHRPPMSQGEHCDISVPVSVDVKLYYHHHNSFQHSNGSMNIKQLFFTS